MDCKRINIFIGKPNVGKSNILEALSLFGATYEPNHSKFLSTFMRFESYDNLFFDQDLKNEIKVMSNIGVARLRYHFNNINQFDLTLGPNSEIFNSIDNGKSINDFINAFEAYLNRYRSINAYEDPKMVIPPYYQYMNYSSALRPSSYNSDTPVKKYDFKKLNNYDNLFPHYLIPPDGNNLFAIVHGNKNFYKKIAPMFEEYGLDFVLKIQEKKFEIQKKIDGIVYSYPYSTIADTLQRMIFYLAAIESNSKSVLLFEEPETHSFPPYAQMLANKVVDSKENQFFITSHSPYLLQTIIEKSAHNELAIFLTYFEDYETKIKPLSKSDIQEIVDESIDVFYNLDRFLSNE